MCRLYLFLLTPVGSARLDLIKDMVFGKVHEKVSCDVDTFFAGFYGHGG